MISIIIPTFVEEKIIAETILGLKSLTLPHEIIVADGNSPDKTVEISKKLADRVIISKTIGRRTASQNRNAGAQIAQGDFLVFLDSSCSIPNLDLFFTKCLNNFKGDEKLVAMTCLIRVLPEKEGLFDKIFFSINDLGYMIMNNIFNIGAAAGKFQMIRKKSFIQIGGFREDLAAAEDIDMFRRLSRIGRVMSDTTLTVFHTGRRAHQIGWGNLLFIWTLNSLSFFTSGKAFSREWPVIR